MTRTIAMLLVLALAACSGQTTASPTATPPVSPTAPTATPDATVAPGSPETPAPSAPSAPAFPSWDGDPAEGLAFIRILEPNNPVTQVFVVEADGSLRQVTGLGGGTGASNPVWSHDGSRIAFTGPKHGETTFRGMVAVINADGTDERQMAEGAFPRWSPDDTLIAFQEVDDVTGEDLSMYLVDPETGDVTDLGLGYEARWIGMDRLAHGGNSYAADGALTTHLFIMTLATGESELIADSTRAFPSPDGSMLLLETEDAVHLASPEGTVIRELAAGGDPVWSPDGTRVAVMIGHDNDANPVWDVIDLEGNVLRSDVIGAGATWSPDGSRLALEVYRPTMPVIQVVDLATGEIVWEHEGQQPAWRP